MDIRKRLALWKIIPHSWMVVPCPGEKGCRRPDGSFHTADTTFWFWVAYG